MNEPKYNSDERELILRVMDLYFHSPEYAHLLDFESLHVIFPELSEVFNFMQSDDYENKNQLHSIIDNMGDNGLKRMLSLARGFYEEG